MAFSLNQKSNKKQRIISDINVTPFVDVLLVLLIIFMVAAPMMTSNVEVNLPQGATTPSKDKDLSLTITIKADGAIFLQDNQVQISFLPAKLLELSGNKMDSKINIRADKSLDYGRVMEIVKTVSMTGFNQVALVTELTN